MCVCGCVRLCVCVCMFLVFFCDNYFSISPRAIRLMSCVHRYMECLPSKAQCDTFMEEWCESYADLATRYPTVFCHMDVHDNNIIYNTKTGQMCTRSM